MLYLFFVLISILLIPVSYFFTVYEKRGSLFFIFCGLPILILDFIADQYYFWVNNFRTNLKLTVISRKKSNIKYDSVKEIMCFFEQLKNNKIKSISCEFLTKHFRKNYEVSQNL